MKNKLIFLIILIGIFGLVVGIYKIVNDRLPKEGVLKIITRPTVSVFLDNKQLSNTPYETKLNKGDYSVKLVPESNITPVASWQGTVKVMPNLLTYVNADLAETEFESAVEILWLEKTSGRSAEIAVTSSPDSVSISMDGELKGASPLIITDVSAGDHVISLASDGFLPRTIKVKTTAGYRLMVSAKLALSSQPVPSAPEATASAGSIVVEPTLQAEELNTPISTPSVQISPTKIPPSKPYVLIKDTPTGFLRVRTEPTTQASESGRVNPGEMYPYLNADNGWYKITFKENSEGWISAQYAEKIE